MLLINLVCDVLGRREIILVKPYGWDSLNGQYGHLRLIKRVARVFQITFIDHELLRELPLENVEMTKNI